MTLQTTLERDDDDEWYVGECAICLPSCRMRSSDGEDQSCEISDILRLFYTYNHLRAFMSKQYPPRFLGHPARRFRIIPTLAILDFQHAGPVLAWFPAI